MGISLFRGISTVLLSFIAFNKSFAVHVVLFPILSILALKHQ
jgi:hypothetical protein